MVRVAKTNPVDAGRKKLMEDQEKLKKKIDKALPGIKYERLPGTREEDIEVTDDKGKKHKGKEVHFTEKEIDAVHLKKIGPMFYFCTDNNKVFLIPFSIQFSATDVLNLMAKVAHNLEAELKKVMAKDEEAKKNTPKKEGMN